jgi:hypothetical protein
MKTVLRSFFLPHRSVRTATLILLADMGFFWMVAAEDHAFTVWLILFGLWLVKDTAALIRSIYRTKSANAP